MDRLISEQQVLKVLDNLKANFTCYDSVTLDEVASHVKGIPPAESNTEHWISCSKKLPDDYDAINRQWLMECVNEGWIKFDTEKDKNRFIHLVRDMAPPVTPQSKPEEQCINRQEAIDAFQIFREYESNRSSGEWVDRIETVLNQLPSVTPQPKSEDIAKAFQMGLAIGFGERYDELDRVIDEIKKIITPQKKNEVDT